MPSDRRPTRRQTAGRIVLSFLIFAFCGTLLATRLFLLQLVEGARLAAAARAEEVRTITLLPARGEILDDHGTLLAVDVPGHLCYALPHWVTDPAGEARALAPILHRPVEVLRQLLSASTWYVTLSAAPLTPAATSAIERLNLPGVGVEDTEYRLYPQGSLAANVLGFVSESGQGLGGVEESYNAFLAGKPGREVVTVDAAGNPLPSFGSQVEPPRPGDGLQLTLNATLEAFAEAALRSAVARDHLRSGRILILDPRTGGILALAEWPTFNPNDWAASPLTDMNDSAVQNDYPPGSTFKPLTLAAALLDHVVSPATIFYDYGSITIDGRLLHDWNLVGFGRIDLARALAMSSDVAFMRIGLWLGKERFYRDVLQRFGLEAPSPVDLPGSSPPLLPAESSARRLDVAEMAFGQTLSLSPISLAAAVAAIADGGIWHAPHVGEAILTQSGRRLPLRFPSRRVLPTDIAQEVARMMVGVVRDGTGNLAAVPGYTIAGKTGTAELPVAGRYHGHYMASFIGFGPLPHPRLLILVQLNDPRGAYYGGDIAAPVFRQVMSEALTYLRIPPNQPQPNSGARVSVPSLVGDTLAEAKATTSRLGLVLFPSGDGVHVLDQYPLPGTKVGLGGEVAVDLGHVGKGEVPSVLGLPIRPAAWLLARQGYNLTPIGTGLAVSQSPAPGTRLPAGGTVRVLFREP